VCRDIKTYSPWELTAGLQTTTAASAWSSTGSQSREQVLRNAPSGMRLYAQHTSHAIQPPPPPHPTLDCLLELHLSRPPTHRCAACICTGLSHACA